MRDFEPNPAALITSEMLRQNLVPDSNEALRIIHLDEAETGKDVAIALGTAAVSLASSAGILALSGLTLPILVPVTICGLAAVQAWNNRVTQRDRQNEADFLTDHPEILDLVEKKISQGEPLTRVAAALETAYRAYSFGDVPTIALTAAPSPAQLPAIGVQTQLGAIPVHHTVETAIAHQPLNEISPGDRRALIDRLREECPALLKLVKSHPIRAVGVQRSGKTTLVKRLALLRMVLIPGHQVIAATPHNESGNQYPDRAFRVVGITQGQRDYPAIEREWDGLADRVARCQESSITTIWDEFGLFDQVMPEDKIKTNLTSCLRETMKFGEYPVFIVHGETAAFLPGSKGLVTVFLSSTVRVEAIGEPSPDEIGLETIRPTGKFTVTWLDGSKDEGQIPTWLTEQYLLSLIGHSGPARTQPVAVSHHPGPVQVQPVAAAIVPEPEHYNQKENPTPARESGQTAPLEQRVADFIRSRPPGEGGVKLRDIKRRFKNEPEKIEGICHTLAYCFPDKFQIKTEKVNGVESTRIEAIS